MSTLRDYISRIRSTHKLLSGDGLIKDRAIADELKSINLLLMKRDTDKRRLWSTDAAFHNIGCLRMAPYSLSECCDAPEGIMVSRSVLALPKIAEGKNGHLIQGVYNIQGSKKVDEVTLNRYLNMLKLPNRKKGNFFFIFDNHLIVTNPDIQAVRIRAHFEDTIPQELMYPKNCDVCKSSSPPCLNPLDEEFKSPGYLSQQIIMMTSQALLSSYFRLNDDKTTDAKDDQVAKT